MKTDIDKGFIQGIGYAVRILVDIHDQPGYAHDIIQQSGYTISTFEKYCDESDIPYIRIAAKD